MNSMKKVLMFAVTFFVPVVVYAAMLTNPIHTTDLSAFLAKILQVVAIIAGPIIVLFLVYVGFLFVSSQGNPEKLKEAKNYFFWAIVGALLVLGAEALSIAISRTIAQL